MLHAFIYGFIMALGLIMPLGVQNIFIFNQGASQKHFYYALPSVITAGICDSILIIFSVLGISLIVLNNTYIKLVVFFIGFIFLLYMGLKTWHIKKHKTQISAEPYSSRRQIIFALSVSILNPHAIIDSVAVIGTNALRFSGQAKITYTIACLVVSWLWFLSLAILGHFVHHFDSSGKMIYFLNKLSAMIIWLVASFIGWEIFLIIRGF